MCVLETLRPEVFRREYERYRGLFLWGSCEGKLQDVTVRWDEQACACVVIAFRRAIRANDSERDFPIQRPWMRIKDPDTFIFHAGTKKRRRELGDQRRQGLRGNGLRPEVFDAAAAKAYNAVSKIDFEHMFFRRDIRSKKGTAPYFVRQTHK